MNVHIIDDIANLENLKQYVKDNNFEYVAIDTETDSVTEKKAKLYGVGLCFQDEESFYIPVRRPTGESVWTKDQEHAIAQWTKDISSKHKVLMHNGVYDVLVLSYNWNIDLTHDLYSDTILLKHAIDEERPFGLKEVSVKYLGPWADKAQEALYANIEKNGGSTTKTNLEMFKADTGVLGEYCGWDVMLTFKLFNLFQPRLIEEGLHDLFYIDETMPLYKEVTIPMKRNGFPIDVKYFENLNKEIKEDLDLLETKVIKAIQPIISPYVESLILLFYPIKVGGLFPKYCAEMIGFQLPLGKTGKVTLARKEIDKILEPQSESHRNYLAWLKHTEELNPDIARQTQAYWFKQDYPDRNYIFNLKSNDHLKYLFFKALGEKALSKTDTGEPQIDDDVFEAYKDKYEWVKYLIDFKKLTKIQGTYIEGILDRHVDGVIYTSMLQFGTTSGRFSSKDPNLQNLPATKEDDSGLSEIVLKYVNSIRAGFIAPEGSILVDADESALEPRCFASVSGDKNLQKIFFTNEDMYSSIAIRTFNETECSPYKKDANYLGLIKPALRKLVKVFALAVAYGAEAGRIASLTGKTKQEAQELIDNYLSAYPGLKDYIKQCHAEAKHTGKVVTRFGRVRHLPRVKHIHNVYGDRLLNDWYYVRHNNLGEVKYEFKNGLNNSTNMPIQGLAAHIMNRAAINISRKFKKQNINGYIALQVHDQLIAIVKQDQGKIASDIVQYEMENAVKIDVPLIAEPKLAHNMRDSH